MEARTLHSRIYVQRVARQSFGRTITEADIVIMQGHSGISSPTTMDCRMGARPSPSASAFANGTMTFAIGIGADGDRDKTPAPSPTGLRAPLPLSRPRPRGRHGIRTTSPSGAVRFDSENASLWTGERKSARQRTRRARPLMYCDQPFLLAERRDGRGPHDQ